jgi:hypothetical protein
VRKNRQNFSDWAAAAQNQHGIAAPNGLIYERHHSLRTSIKDAQTRYSAW